MSTFEVMLKRDGFTKFPGNENNTFRLARVGLGDCINTWVRAVSLIKKNNQEYNEYNDIMKNMNYDKDAVNTREYRTRNFPYAACVPRVIPLYQCPIEKQICRVKQQPIDSCRLVWLSKCSCQQVTDIQPTVDEILQPTLQQSQSDPRKFFQHRRRYSRSRSRTQIAQESLDSRTVTRRRSTGDVGDCRLTEKELCMKGLSEQRERGRSRQRDDRESAAWFRSDSPSPRPVHSYQLTEDYRK